MQGKQNKYELMDIELDICSLQRVSAADELDVSVTWSADICSYNLHELQLQTSVPPTSSLLLQLHHLLQDPADVQRRSCRCLAIYHHYSNP